jgi:regulatory protein
MAKVERSSGLPPDAAALQDAALAYLARYAATEAGLRRVLERRVDRWARAAAVVADRETLAAQVEQAKRVARDVAARLAAAGAVNDAMFAETRARSLARSGRSRQAVTAHLIAKGVDAAAARAASPTDEDNELAAALVLARRKRIGPFRSGGSPDQAARRRELAILARAGFPQPLARKALAMQADEAETRINELRR